MASSTATRRVLLAVVALGAVAGAQPDARPSGVDGTVVNALTGEPLPRAHVTFKTSVQGTIRKYGAIANEQGRFSVNGIDPGTYQTSVELPGFLFAPQRAADNGRVVVAEHASVSDLKLKLMPQGVIAGHVLDAGGNPVERAMVTAFRGSRVVGQQPTDAAGEFRVSGLPVGQYTVQAVPGFAAPFSPPEVRTDGSREERNGATYFGGTARQQEATPVEVHAGAEAGGLEIRLLHVPVVRVSGTFTGIPPDTERINVDIMTSFFTRRAYPTSKFAFWGLQGAVRITALTTNDDDEPLTIAPVDLEVGDSDIDNLELALMPAFDVAGHIEWDGPAAQADQIHEAKLRLDPLREMDKPVTGAFDEDGGFRLANIKPDRYLVSLEGLPNNVYVKSIRLGARELPGAVLDVRRGAGDQALSLILSTAGGQISGMVRDVDGPLLEAAVGLMDDQSGSFHTLRTARTAGDGAYALSGIAPGTYRLFLFDPADLTSLVRAGMLGVYEATAEKIEISAGDKLTRDLRK